MKYALFSDIHGNYTAFSRMMDSLSKEHVSGYLFCGDMVGYYYEADKIIQEIKNISNFYAVCGNHDDLYIRAARDSKIRQAAIETYGNAYLNINEEVVEYLKTLPRILSASLDGVSIEMLHGSPANYLEGRLYPDTPLDFKDITCDYLFAGHTHYQMRKPLNEVCTIVNSGSIGQPRDGKGFSYCIIDFSSRSVRFNQVWFDLAPLLAQIKKNDPDKPYLSEVLLRNRGRNA